MMRLFSLHFSAPAIIRITFKFDYSPKNLAVGWFLFFEKGYDERRQRARAGSIRVVHVTVSKPS